MKLPYLECGKIINTHGVKGVVKIDSYCDSARVLAKLGRVFLQTANGNYTERRVRSASVAKGFVLASIEGVDTLEDAIVLKGRTLYALREDIPLKDGAYFVADLIGLPVVDAETGKVYGTLLSVDTMPAGDMYTIKVPSGKEVLFPAVKEFLSRIDPEGGIYIKPIEGFFDE